MFQDLIGRFAAVAFNGAEILVVLVTVLFGVVFMLMNPRPVFGAMLYLLPEEHHHKARITLQRIEKFIPAWAGATELGMLMIVFQIIYDHKIKSDPVLYEILADVLQSEEFHNSLWPGARFAPAVPVIWQLMTVS